MMKKNMSRRDFIRLSSTIGVGFIGLQVLSCMPKKEKQRGLPLIQKYGALFPDKENFLKLPKNFSYKIISKMGTPMSDGFLTPGMHDGMGAFSKDNNKTILVCNHENRPDKFHLGPFGVQNELYRNIPKKKVYDNGKGLYPSLGGTTTLIYNHETEDVEREYLSLAGTIRNCAGGVTPWRSWISCEEIVVPKGYVINKKQQATLEKAHGYVFEVFADEEGLSEPIPIKEMGRFNHEAACVDPKTGIVYLTEDEGDGLLYRFIPNERGMLHRGGRLQALAIKGREKKEVRNWDEKKLIITEDEFEVEWVDLEDVDAPKEDLRKRGYKSGAVAFARGEGMWFGDGELYFCCTNGGKIKKGQIFCYRPSPNEGKKDEPIKPGKLSLFIESSDEDIMKACDNISIAPWGDLIVCEDNGKGSFINGITPNGEVYKIAQNIGWDSEFAGGVFSSDGSTLFVNVQVPGLTLAITGDWG